MVIIYNIYFFVFLSDDQPIQH